MRFAFVQPCVCGVMGNRLAFGLERQLAKQGHHVDLYTFETSTLVLPEVQRMVYPAKLHCLHLNSRKRLGFWGYLNYNLRKSYDQILANEISKRHRESAYDLILVFSDEGRWLGDMIRKECPTPRPLTGVVLMELIEYNWFFRNEKSFPTLRWLAWPAVQALHWAHQRALRGYNLHYSISPWSDWMATYFYGIETRGQLIAVDDSFFEFDYLTKDSYIALPTAALSMRQARIAQEVAARGVKLVSFGPRAVEGIPHLGFLSEADMQRVIASASALLFLFEYEALGLMPLEALALGTPVITQRKQGPGSILDGLECVSFGESSGELAGLCHAAILGFEQKTNPPPEACRRSVLQYTTASMAATFLQSLEIVSDRKVGGL